MFPKCYLNDFDPYYRLPAIPQPLFPGPMEPIPRQMPAPTPTPAPTPAPTPTPTPPGFEAAPGSPISQDTEYTQGYLKTQIGKRVKIFFLIGTNIVQDREGILTDVGISYVILKEIDTNYKILCDIYSIKFVTIYP